MPTVSPRNAFDEQVTATRDQGRALWTAGVEQSISPASATRAMSSRVPRHRQRATGTRWPHSNDGDARPAFRWRASLRSSPRSALAIDGSLPADRIRYRIRWTRRRGTSKIAQVTDVPIGCILHPVPLRVRILGRRNPQASPGGEFAPLARHWLDGAVVGRCQRDREIAGTLVALWRRCRRTRRRRARPTEEPFEFFAWRKLPRLRQTTANHTQLVRTQKWSLCRII